MYTPITKRIFNHPKFKRGAVARQEEDPKAKVYGPGGEKVVEADPDIEKGDLIPKEPSTNRVEKGSDEEAFYLKNKKRCDELTNEQKLDPKNKCTGFAQEREPDKETCKEGFAKNETTGKCEKIEKTPGYEGDLYKQKQSTVKQPWQVRQQNRAVKKSNKDIRRSEIKLSKLGTRNADGTYTMNDGLSARKQAKFRENLRELESFQSQAENIGKDVKTGKIAGETYISGQEKMNQADLGGPDAQKEMLKNKREFEQSQTNKIVQSQTKQADKAVAVDDTPNSFDAVASNINSTPDFQNSVNTDFGQYKFGNYTPKFGTGVVSGFFKKAKPLSKNYFANRKK